MTITAQSTATVGTEVYAYARRGTSGVNGYAYKVTVVDPLYLAPGTTTNGVARTSSNSWQYDETDPDGVISVSTTGSGTTHNVSIAAAANKTGEATCWMTNRTTSVGYYAYKVYVADKVEDIVVSNVVVVASGSSQVLTNDVGQTIAWSDDYTYTPDDQTVAQVINAGGLVAVNATNVGYTNVKVAMPGTNYFFTVCTVAVGIEKTIKVAEDPNDTSNVTIRVTAHVNCPRPPAVHNILFLSSMCIEHGYTTEIAKRAIDTLATKGNVKWFMYGLHLPAIAAAQYDKSYADLPEIKKSGTVLMGGTVAVGTDYTNGCTLMDTGDKVSCNNLKSYLIELDRELDGNHQNYDYVVLSFDGNLLACYYDSEWSVPPNKAGTCDEDDTDLNDRVAQKLRWYYENKRVIWLHAPINRANGVNPPFSGDNLYVPNTAMDPAEWEVWGCVDGWFPTLNRGWEAMVAVLDPVTYLGRSPGNRYTDSTTFTHPNSSVANTVYAANANPLQVPYNDADKVSQTLELNVQTALFDAKIEDTIVNLHESLSVTGNRFFVWNGETAPENLTNDTYKVIADLPTNTTHWALKASSTSGSYSVATNLVDVIGDYWYMYEIDVVDNGTFLEECIKLGPPYAIPAGKPGTYLVNPNDGDARLTVFATVNGDQKPVLVEDAALMMRWEKEKTRLNNLWITDHYDAGSNMVHLAFQPLFDKPVDMNVWIPFARRNDLVRYVEADTEAGLANAPLQQIVSFRGGTGMQDVQKGWCWITVPSANTNKLYKIVICDGSVQLWKDGPSFASCNVGAAKPEEFGYYFWWGDTVGYTHDGTKWVSVSDGTTSITFNDAAPANSTYGKTVSELKTLGYIDDESNPVLNAAHDAARAHLGAPWRMMTDAELQKLVDPSYCTREWTDDYNGTGVKGYIVRGAQEPFRNNKIFIPAAGRGNEAAFGYGGERGRYWSGTPKTDTDTSAKNLDFSSIEFLCNPNNRYLGFTVRPVK